MLLDVVGGVIVMGLGLGGALLLRTIMRRVHEARVARHAGQAGTAVTDDEPAAGPRVRASSAA